MKRTLKHPFLGRSLLQAEPERDFYFMEILIKSLPYPESGSTLSVSLINNKEIHLGHINPDGIDTYIMVSISDLEAAIKFLKKNG